MSDIRIVLNAIMLAIIVIGVILLTISIKLRIMFSYNETDGWIEISYLFFKKRIKPFEKKEKKAKDKGTVDDGESSKKRDKKIYLKLLKDCFGDLLSCIVKIVDYIKKNAITVYDIKVTGQFGADDAMNTGVMVGAVNAGIYNIIGEISRSTELKNWSVDIKPDFEKTGLRVGMYSELKTNLWHILVIGIKALKTVVKILFKVWRLNRNE